MKGRPRSTDPEVCKREYLRRKYREEHRVEYNEYQRNLFKGDSERAGRRREYMREYIKEYMRNLLKEDSERSRRYRELQRKRQQNWRRKHHQKKSIPE
jgi:hypothetical protein